MTSRIIRANSEDFKGILSFTFAMAGEEEISSADIQAPVQEETFPALPVDPGTDEQHDSLLATAAQQAESLVQQAQLRAAEVEKEAYQRGFSEGQKAGKEVGEKMVEALLKQFAQTLEELSALRKQVFGSAEREVVRLSLEIAKKVVKREVTIDQEVILTLVKVALNRLSGEALMTVRVNPRDYQSIQKHRASEPTFHEGIKLVEDPSITRGGCLVETESGIIDARVEEQFREIEKGFFE